MLFLLLVLRFAGGLGTWMLYSQIVKVAVQPAARNNAIVSQTRLEGNATIMQQLAEPIPSRQIDASIYDTLVWGTHDVCSGSNVKKLGKYLILDFSPDDDSLSIFASCKIPEESLRTLVGSKRKGRDVTNPFHFRVWMEALADNVPIKQTFNLLGKYCYSFRDYWNFEEAGGMERSYGSIRMLKLRSNRNRPSELIVHETGNCTLTDYCFIYCIVPMYIQWEGQANDDTIMWSRTMMRKGWKRLGRTIDRPPMAEKFRQEPWLVRMPSQDESGDLIVLERKGIGRLAFARDSVFP